MHKFSTPIETGNDPATAAPIVGFSVNDMFIHEPFLSECGRFAVDPKITYGLSIEDANALVALNKTMAEACQAAIEAGRAKILAGLGISADEARTTFEAVDGYARSADITDELSQFLLCNLQQPAPQEREPGQG